jgi:hypothetical protein
VQSGKQMEINCPKCNHRFDASPLEREIITKWAIEEDKKFFAAMTPEELEHYNRTERESGF